MPEYHLGPDKQKLGPQDFEELVGEWPENAIGSHTVIEPKRCGK
jgi:hypothetical protein